MGYYWPEGMLLETEENRYYLQNEDERMKIAENGQKKIIEQFDYSCAWKKIFGVVF
mgnify:CR=1 FL=1